MKRYFLIFLLIICVPVSASTDYSSLEHISVAELPEASDDTVDKIYDYNNKYFVTEKKYIEGNKRHFQVGDDLAKANVCVDFDILDVDTAIVFNNISNIFPDYDISYYQNINDSIKNDFSNFKLDNFNSYSFVTDPTVFNFGTFKFIFNFNRNFFQFSLDFVLSDEVHPYKLFSYYGNKNSGSSSFTSSNILDDNYCFKFNESSNSSRTVVSKIDESNLIYNLLYLDIDSGYSYSWKEINYSDWYRYTYSDDDLYLFYSFDDISKFNIFSDYDFTTFSDFEKLCITIIINLFFCIFLGLCIYIIIKVFNKFITILFR